MKGKCLFVPAMFLLLLMTVGCSTDTSKDWAQNFVFWKGYLYVVTDEYVEIKNELGEVTKYSDAEGMYSGNFSNAYKKGTKFYSIKGKSSKEAIAIQESEGKYRKLVNNGKYGKINK